MNGLDIEEEQFIKLKPVERDLLIYKNVQQYRKKEFNNRINTRIQYFLISGIVIYLGYKGSL
jgi:hypothetical protein